MTWTFVQEGQFPTTLTLTGWQQPYGRPRQGEIVDVGIEVVRKVTRVGGNVDPIVNAFTTKGKDWHMHGRWMDGPMGLGAGTALQMALKWKQFVADKRIVLASWDNLIAYRIFIHDMSMKVESPGEVAWEMHADVITDLSQAGPFTIPPIQTPFSMAALMASSLPAAVKPWTNPLGVLSWALSILPTLALGMSLIESAILLPFNLIYQITSQISDFASASQTDLMGLASGVGQVQTGLFNMRQATDGFTATLQSMQRDYSTQPTLGQQPLFSGPNMITLQATKVQSDVANTALLALMAYLQSQVQQYLRGATGTAYTAIDGDTWESISLATLGAIDAASQIRDLNGITGGDAPLSGKRYQIPQRGV